MVKEKKSTQHILRTEFSPQYLMVPHPPSSKTVRYNPSGPTHLGNQTPNCQAGTIWFSMCVDP